MPQTGLTEAGYRGGPARLAGPTESEGHAAEPSVVLDSLAPEDTVADLQRRSDLVARRLGLLGRVNLLASGELESAVGEAGVGDKPFSR